MGSSIRIPRHPEDDYSEEAAASRRSCLGEALGADLRHVGHYSVAPPSLKGNIESFTGVAQVPIGVAGPLTVHGQHSGGHPYVIPMATTEGTLVASYNRGIKLLNRSGGVTCVVSDDRMQRAPVFEFESALEARDFRGWVNDHAEHIAAAAEATTSFGKLLDIETHLANCMAYLRFSFSTGDAAGQNMVGKATMAACQWIQGHYEGIRNFFLESNMATDKKPSFMNTLRTRGKHVTAEATIKAEHLIEDLRISPERFHHFTQLSNVGTLLSGANNNGGHSANAIAAIFIATGQDAANVAESSAATFFLRVTDAGDLYASITLPSLIVATHGGGTGLPTQSECLGLMGCVGRGKALRLAEIIAGVVLAGDLSLGAAIASEDWVSSHERMGRNR